MIHYSMNDSLLHEWFITACMIHYWQSIRFSVSMAESNQSRTGKHEKSVLNFSVKMTSVMESLYFWATIEIFFNNPWLDLPNYSWPNERGQTWNINVFQLKMWCSKNTLRRCLADPCTPGHVWHVWCFFIKTSISRKDGVV